MYQFLNCVTVTGADDSIDPGELFELAADFPFLEFGILLSASSVGGQRFPSYEWQHDLARECDRRIITRDPSIAVPHLSGHLCGDWVRYAFQGSFAAAGSRTPLWPFLARIQLNTHGVKHEANIPSLISAANLASVGRRQFIFQYDNENTETINAVVVGLPQVNFGALHDLSHGAGLVPPKWERKFVAGYTGYAGGLGPENVAEQLEAIAEAHIEGNPSPHRRAMFGTDLAWIDAETRLYESGKFSIARVRAFAEAARPWLRK